MASVFCHCPVSKLYLLIMMAGIPAATQQSGIFLVTTALAPITEFLPTEAQIIQTFSPIHAPESIFTGFNCFTGCAITGN